MSYCIKDPTDEQILRIYARENNTQRGEDNSAQAGPIASALKVLMKRTFEESRSRSERRGQLARDLKQDSSRLNGYGTVAIERILGLPKHSTSVVIQLANLKASGDSPASSKKSKVNSARSRPHCYKRQYRPPK